MTNEMTAKEAIKWLKDIERSFPEAYFGEWRKALRMANKALEQLQDVHDTCKNCIEFSEFKQQTSEDCISRQAAGRK